jgi:hypothetical protein
LKIAIQARVATGSFEAQRVALNRLAEAHATYTAAASRARVGAGSFAAVGSSLYKFMGGPVGIAFTAAAAATYYFATQTDKAAEATQKHEDAVSKLKRIKDQLNGMTETAAERTKREASEHIKSAQAALKEAEAQAKLLEVKLQNPSLDSFSLAKTGLRPERDSLTQQLEVQQNRVAELKTEIQVTQEALKKFDDTASEVAGGGVKTLSNETTTLHDKLISLADTTRTDLVKASMAPLEQKLFEVDEIVRKNKDAFVALGEEGKRLVQVTKANTRAFDALEKELKAQEALKSLIEETRTPLEKYRQELEELEKLHVFADTPEELDAINRKMHQLHDEAGLVSEPLVTIQHAFENIHDRITDVILGAERFSAVLKGVGAELTSALVTDLIVQPATNDIRTLLGLQSPVANGAAGGGAGGGIGDLVQLGGNLLPTGGLVNGINSFGANVLGTGTPLPWNPSASFAGTGATLTSILGPAALGFGIGGMFGGRGDVGGALGGGLGGYAAGAGIGMATLGTAANFILPGAGILAGGLLGGMFGGSRPHPASNFSVDAGLTRSGGFASAVRPSSKHISTEAAEQLAAALEVVTRQMASVSSVDLSSIGIINGGVDDGTGWFSRGEWIRGNPTDLVTFDPNDEASAENALADFGVILVRQALEASNALDDTLAKSLQHIIDTTDTTAASLSDLDLLLNFDTIIASMGETQEAVGPYATQMQELHAVFDAARPRVDALGLSVSKLDGVALDTEDRLRNKFITSIEDAILAMQDNYALQLKQLEEQKTRDLREAEALGAGRLQVMRYYRLREIELLEAQQQEIVQERQASFNASQQALQQQLNAEQRLIQVRDAAVNSAVNAYQQLFAVSAQVDSAFSTLGTSTQATRGVYQSLVDNVSLAGNAVIEVLQSHSDTNRALIDTTTVLRDRMRDLNGSIHDYSESLLLGDLSTLNPTQKLSEALRQYEEVYAQAQTGDVDALAQVQDASGTYLEVLRSIHASGTEYVAGFNRIQSDLSTLQGITQAEDDRLTDEITSLELVIDTQLDNVIAALQAGDTSLVSAIDTTTLGIAGLDSKLALLESAIMSAEQHNAVQVVAALDAVNIRLAQQDQSVLASIAQLQQLLHQDGFDEASRAQLSALTQQIEATSGVEDAFVRQITLLNEDVASNLQHVHEALDLDTTAQQLLAEYQAQYDQLAMLNGGFTSLAGELSQSFGDAFGAIEQAVDAEHNVSLLEAQLDVMGSVDGSIQTVAQLITDSNVALSGLETAFNHMESLGLAEDGKAYREPLYLSEEIARQLGYNGLFGSGGANAWLDANPVMRDRFNDMYSTVSTRHGGSNPLLSNITYSDPRYLSELLSRHVGYTGAFASHGALTYLNNNVSAKSTYDALMAELGGGYNPLISDISIERLRAAGIPGFADGGNPPIGRVFLVGERGPELMMARSAMHVIPNHRLPDLSFASGASKHGVERDETTQVMKEFLQEFRSYRDQQNEEANAIWQEVSRLRKENATLRQQHTRGQRSAHPKQTVM